MKKIMILATAILFASCKNTKTEVSQQLNEKAVIVVLIHSPSEHRLEVTQTAYNNGYMATDYSGNTGMKISDTHQLTSTTIPERFGVVFQCQHGTFTIEGDELKHNVLYQKLFKNVGDTVNIIYKEVYEVTYEKDKKTGKEIEVNRVLYKLDFVDAQLIK
jgi:hypothetical protein